ncbi:SGNH/GDSL hydrolase family protein [Rhodococcus sp. RS1C4]|uniref:SGNH/GDSL hydrolase family protein n=1 Tax=Rhodococcoides fascians TaxID=1828 RepID=UPI0009B8E8E6|nr:MULTISPECIES: SGNH/GDSL hydrolase family protein [Rhodococcus]OZC49065.1 SGNH/GDSL hydrolase family protein [Rhodococcus sp. RS1C4]
MTIARIRSILACALAIAGAALLLTAPTVSAAPDGGATLVTMGDSFTATAPILGDRGDGCVRPPTSWPAQLADQLALGGTDRFVDVSCNGGTIDTGDGYTLVQQARKAAAEGAFGPATRAVTIQAGWNDTWGASPGRAFPSVDCLLDLVRGCGLDAADQGRLPDYRAVNGQAFADRVRTVVEYVRYYAPNAKVVLVGYPEVFTGGHSAACVQVGGGTAVQPNASGYITYLSALDSAQREAARILGIEFFDALAVTAGHGSCTADPWIGGFTGVDSLYVGAPIHPTPHGNAVLASALRGRLAI